MPTVVGIDATRGRGRDVWIAVTIDDDGLRAMSVHRSLAEALELAQSAEAVTLNLPLGHDDRDGRKNQGRRACDEAARDFLHPYGERLPLAVPPSLFDLGNRAAAMLLVEETGWPAPDTQRWELRDRIVDANKAWATDHRIHEAHAEVSYQALLRQGDPEDHLAKERHTTAGFHERLQLLHTVGLRPSRSFGGVGRAHPEDVVDATILAWTAKRMVDGTSDVFPSEAPTDATTGRPVAIHA